MGSEPQLIDRTIATPLLAYARLNTLPLPRLLAPSIFESTQLGEPSLTMDAAKLLSGSTVMFAPSLHPLRTIASLSSGFFTPPSKIPSFQSKSLADKEPAVSAPRRRLALKCGAVGGGITEIDESQFVDLVLKCERPVLVEFVANWCGPCRLISPAMEWVAQVRFGFLSFGLLSFRSWSS